MIKSLIGPLKHVQIQKVLNRKGMTKN